MSMFKSLPMVPVHDLVVHPRDKDLVVATHGRSIYIADVRYIEQLDDTLLAKTLYVFPVNGERFKKSWGNKNYAWGEVNFPKIQIPYYTNKNGIAKITILTNDGEELNTLSDSTEQGLNYYNYDLSIDSNKVEDYKEKINDNLNEEDKYNFKTTDSNKTFLHPGKYKIKISFNGKEKEQSFEIKKPKKSARQEEERELTP